MYILIAKAYIRIAGTVVEVVFRFSFLVLFSQKKWLGGTEY